MMTSSSNTSPKLLFQVHTQIYSSHSLEEALSTLNIDDNDLLIVSKTIDKLLQEISLSQCSDRINISQFGNGEPQEDWVNKIIKTAEKKEYRRIVAIGGGTVIDIAKLCVFGDGRTVEQLFQEKDKLIKKRELIAIPTTCGTGSEVTSVSVVAIGNIHSKVGLQIPALFPDKAILIGSLIETLPQQTFITTSIDALSHSVESFLSPNSTVYSRTLSEEAISLILHNFLEIQETHAVPVDSEGSLIASNMAGMAFSIGGCATMHALSFPLGDCYHLNHGTAIYSVFSAVLNYYKQNSVDLMKLETIIGKSLNTSANSAISKLDELLSSLMEKPNLEKIGINDSICHDMAQSVFDHQQRLLRNSPIKLNTSDLENIYIYCLKKGD